jgi:hypothetical protein
MRNPQPKPPQWIAVPAWLYLTVAVVLTAALVWVPRSCGIVAKPAAPRIETGIEERLDRAATVYNPDTGQPYDLEEIRERWERIDRMMQEESWPPRP